ncbi:MAG: flagellar motor switch protein FliN [SAR324 cluster bacterium]|uniref:Flagellar motor switch protein FliN n=1 Tax=SAR324 cluster bacterium TaxID=2024889 RepID=A0A2A4TBP4_9DELT|nr:MAG: flagellar motor switch protein FliN [SAR324 cluster bacterium]
MAALDTVQEDKKEEAAADPFAAAMTAMDGAADEPKAEPSAGDPFEAAMAALEDGGPPAAPAAEIDPFASALQVAQSEQSVAKSTGKPVEQGVNLDFLMDIKLTITFEVGRAKMFISDLLSLGQGSVIELHRLVGEELEIFVNGQMFATGEVVVVNEKFGARITKILDPDERIQRLGPTA